MTSPRAGHDDAGTAVLVADTVRARLREFLAEPRAELVALRVKRVRGGLLYTSWRPMYKCRVRYRIGGHERSMSVFAKAAARRADFDFHIQIWQALEATRGSVPLPRPLGFVSQGGRNIMLTEYISGFNLNPLLTAASVIGAPAITTPLLRRWARLVAGWLSGYVAHHRTVDPLLTARQVEAARATLDGLRVLPVAIRMRVDEYLGDHATDFLSVGRAPSLDFVARNLILQGGSVFLVDFEPRGSRDVFFNGLEFCADLRAKTRYSFLSSSGVNVIEEAFWKAFGVRTEDAHLPYAKVLFSIHWLHYLLTARREYWKKSTPQWDRYIQNFIDTASHWVP